jgi:hypothetical protein
MFLELADPKTLITDSRDADDYEFIMTEKPWRVFYERR